VRSALAVSFSPCPCEKYTFGCRPWITLMSELVSSCSPSLVAFSLRPLYSNTVVPSVVTPSCCATPGRFSGSMYSTVRSFDWYVY
jgi:hypothetical protein